ncbi:MAG: O-antigen ligase family protein [Sphingobium sp.]
MADDGGRGPVRSGLEAGSGLAVRGVVRRRRTSGLALLPARAPALAALIVSSGALFAGYDSLLGQAVAYLLNAALLVLLLFLFPPPLAFWRRLAPALALIALAALWAAVGHGGVALIPGFAAPRPLAPDLFGVEMLGYAGGVAALLGGAVLGSRPGTVQPFLRWTAGFNLGWIVWGLVLRAGDMQDVFDLWTVTRQGRFTGTIGNANVTAAVAGAMALIVAGQLHAAIGAGWRRRPVPVLVPAGAFLLFAGAMIATASRSALLSLLGLLLLLVLAGQSRGAPGDRLRAFLSSIGVVWIAGALTILLLVAGPILTARFAELDGDAALRLTMWSHYARLAAEAPLYGYGWGGFASLNAHSIQDVLLAQKLWNVNSAHNVLLQLTLNGGLPYCGMILAAFALIAASLAAHLRREGWGVPLLAPVLALAQILACAMVDIALDLPAVVTLFLFLGGLLWGRALRPAESAGSRPVPDSPA